MTFALIGDAQGVGLQNPLGELLELAFADPKVGWTTARTNLTISCTVTGESS